MCKKYEFDPPVCKYGPPPSYLDYNRRFDTIIFDLGGVLMQHNMQGCVAAFREILGEEGVAHYLGLADNGEGENDSLMIQFEQGTVSAEEFVAEILKHSKEGTTEQQVIDAWLSMHAGIPRERLDYVFKLHRDGYHIVLLSNNNELHWADVVNHYPINTCFDHIFLSHEMHLSKPDPEMFKIINKELGCDPDKTVFVDDIEVNRLEAEHAVGWHTCSSVEELKQLLTK